MADERLKNYVLQRAGDDAGLSDDARLVVLAALETDDDLAEVLGDEATSEALVEALTTAAPVDAEPVGAYLKSICVQGFRGIGPKVVLPLPPGPGLVVVAGRNGSGKSTLAEALELALTGANSRWKGRGPVWSQDWRNLHAGEPAEIRIGIAEEGSGATTIGVDWPKGDVPVERMTTWVQRDGQKRADTGVLGWAAALEMYRPLLSYDELGHILEGRPSDFYDQLYKLLGLEQLTTAIARLDIEVKRLKEPGLDLKRVRDELRPVLEAHDDPRAAAALGQLKKTKPDLDVVRPLVTEGAASAVPRAWHEAVRLEAPATAAIADKCAALRSAAQSEHDEAEHSDALAADRATLLAQGLSFHDRHGTQPCPVCGQGTLDMNWSVAARAALEHEQTQAQALTAARAASAQARSALVTAIREVARPPLADDALSALPAARAAFDQFAAMPLDNDSALADHAQSTLAALQAGYEALRAQAAELINARQDAWSPVALQLADWLQKAHAAAVAEPTLKVATEAQKWLQRNAGELRNQRIAPLASQAKDIWAALRQESNVNLDSIRLEGQKTTRRVVLEAAVDGSATEAFGVMSQGELQALALAIFIPRATSPQSPFRFLVLDDPIQAMDPSKIDGFLDVLTELAKDRQVIVFTHDDRLPAAIRRSKTPARLIEVTRGAKSAVHVDELSRPAQRLLNDAFAIAADDAVPDAIKKAAIPVLCREAVEAVSWDVFAAKALTQGRSRDDVEKAWDDAGTTRKRLGLAVNPEDTAAVDKWLSGGSARRATMAVVTKGIHGGSHSGTDDFKAAVNAARLATDDLAKIAR